MEESNQEWKGYLVVRIGRFWKIKNNTQWIGGSFTTLDKAKQWINAQINKGIDKEYKRTLRDIKKEPDIRKRTRRYKELCQTTPNYS